MTRLEPHNRDELHEWARQQHIGPCVARQLADDYACVMVTPHDDDGLGGAIVASIFAEGGLAITKRAVARYYKIAPSDVEKRVRDDTTYCGGNDS